jgi:hypothetical protein
MSRVRIPALRGLLPGGERAKCLMSLPVELSSASTRAEPPSQECSGPTSVTLGAAGCGRVPAPRLSRRGGLERATPADLSACALSIKNAGAASIATARRRCLTDAESNLIYRGGGSCYVLGGED